MNKKSITLFAIGFLVTVMITVPITSIVFAEQSGDTPESGVTSRIKQVYDSLVSLTYGSDSTGGWGDWGEFWNRIRSAAEWTPDGTATSDVVVAGETFYSDSRIPLTGTLALTGNVTPDDVFLGKTFYGNSFTQQTGTWSFLGDADPAHVFAGETFYNNSNVLQTGTWSFLGDATEGDVLTGKTFYSNSSTLLTGTAAPPIDFTNQQYSTRDDYAGVGGGGAEDYMGEESVWTSPIANVWKDERTGVYWSSNQGSMTNNFTAMSLNTCDFFNTTPRESYAGGDADCGVAINYCATLNFGDRTDWYLPSQKELMQAYIDGMYNQAGTTLANAAAFTTTNYFWSSSEVSNNPPRVWRVVLHSGSTDGAGYKANADAVRCLSRD
ncbi:MAG: DUF1566 domain-containing protein [Patescibacteria group bacterium]